ncbi:MAG: hypothetical protein AAF687_10175 [Pseudomonadota bacterium]
MTRTIKPTASLLALALAALPSCASTASESGGEVQSVTYEVPQAYDVILENGTPVKIATSGELTYDGEPVTLSRVKEIFAELRADEIERIAVLPAKDTGFAELVSSISKIATVSDYVFVELETHSKFKRADTDDVAPKQFTGTLGEYEMPVLIGYSAAKQQCAVSLGGGVVDSSGRRALSPEQLYDRSFIWLDTLVQGAGGVEAILQKTDAGRDIVARFQAPPDTPWHCIAGALYAVQRSGWPMIRFEVMQQR